MLSASEMSHLLRPVLGHVLQEQEGLVDVPPLLTLILESPGQDAHDLLEALWIVGLLCDLCPQSAHTSRSHQDLEHVFRCSRDTCVVLRPEPVKQRSYAQHAGAEALLR